VRIVAAVCCAAPVCVFCAAVVFGAAWLDCTDPVDGDDADEGPIFFFQ
jgi:hypothetical protein